MLDKEIREPLFDFLEEFYGKIQHDNAGWEQRLADAMAEYKKNKK